MLNPSLDPDFTGKIDPPDAARPYGNARDALVENDPNATPLLAKKFNDDWGFDAALMAEVGMTPSGDPDAVGDSQRLAAIKKTAAKASEIPFDNIADLKNGISRNGAINMANFSGSRVRWNGFYAPSDGGSNWGIIKIGAHVGDDFSIFSIDANTYVEANLKGKSLNIRKAGADDAIANNAPIIGKVIDYAEAHVTDRFLSGMDIKVPEGTFPITEKIKDITSSRISISGVSPSASVIKADSPNFDYIHFNGTALALYGCGIKNIRFVATGNATAGAQLRTTKLIDAHIKNVEFVGYYDAWVSDGCARTFATGVIFTQDTRTTGTSPRYAMDFRSDSGANNSDVHVTDFQIFMPNDRKGVYSVSIRGADGIYFNSGHQQGGVIVQPSGEGLTTLATVFWDQVYLDKADVENIIFTGSSAIYRNFEFVGGYMRGSIYGAVFNTTGPIEDVRFTGGSVAGHTKSGIDCRNTFPKNIKVTGTGFRDNASSNVLGDSDFIVRGSGHVIGGVTLAGGTANGRGINLTADATDCVLASADVAGSTMGLKVVKSNVTCKLGVITGYVAKNKGSATVLTGTTSITVAHGMSVVPLNTEIQVTPRTSLNGAVDFWVANVTSTTFDIRVTAAPSNNVVFTWQVDATG